MCPSHIAPAAACAQACDDSCTFMYVATFDPRSSQHRLGVGWQRGAGLLVCLYDVGLQANQQPWQLDYYLPGYTSIAALYYWVWCRGLQHSFTCGRISSGVCVCVRVCVSSMWQLLLVAVTWARANYCRI